MKKLVTVLCLVVVLCFGIVACIRLIPEKSRDGLASTPTPTPTQQSTPTQIQTPTPAVPTTPMDTSVYPAFSLSGELHTQTVIVDGVTVGEISFFVPKVSYAENPEIAQRINDVLKIKSDEHIKNYVEECNFLAMDFDPEEMSPYQYTTTAQIYVSEDTVSIKMLSEINYGSVLTEKTVFCYNFSNSTGDEIGLEDTDLDLDALKNAIIEKSLTMSDYVFTENYQNYINEHICNSWYIDKKAITLIYVPMEITSEIHGTVEITVELDA